MGKDRKIISFRLQVFLNLIPYVGAVIVLFLGMFNIHSINKKRLWIGMYYLSSIIPMVIIGGLACLVVWLCITFLQETILKFTVLLIVCYITLLLWGLCFIGVQKGVIDYIKKKEVRAIENNVF